MQMLCLSACLLQAGVGNVASLAYDAWPAHSSVLGWHHGCCMQCMALLLASTTSEAMYKCLWRPVLHTLLHSQQLDAFPLLHCCMKALP